MSDYSDIVQNLAREIAKDQIAQDIANVEKFATKKELSEIGNGEAKAVAIRQLIALYNGYMGTSLDFRDYLNTSADELPDLSQISADIDGRLDKLEQAVNNEIKSDVATSKSDIAELQTQIQELVVVCEDVAGNK